MSDYQIKPYRGSLALYWFDKTKPPGKRRQRHALGTNNHTEAEAIARAFWQRRSAPEASTVGQIVNAYIKDREPEIVSTDRQRYAWQALKSDFENLLPEHVDRKACLEYAKSRADFSPSTYHYELGLLRQALNWAERLGLIKSAPHIWMPQKAPPRDEYLTKKQFRKFLKSCAPHVKLYATLGAATAARPAAILELTWGRVDLKRRLIDLNPVGRIRTKKKRPVVPINQKAYAALKDAKPDAITEYVIEWAGGPIKSMRNGFRRASEKSGVRCTPYMLRHSAAIWMAEGGVPMSEVSQYLGHSDSTTTERHYAKYSPGYLRGAARRLKW